MITSRFSRQFLNFPCRTIRVYVSIVILWLLVIIFCRLTSNRNVHHVPREVFQETNQLEETGVASLCTEDRGNYSHLRTNLDNQPELVEFLKIMQPVPLILIDQHIIEQLLNEDSTESHFIEPRDFFQFALPETQWHCLETAITDIKEWLVEKTEAAIAFRNKNISSVKILVRKLFDKGFDYQILTPFSGEFLQTDEHVIAFVQISEKLLIIVNGAFIFFPTNPRLFLQRLKRGNFIDCRQPTNRNAEPEQLNSRAIGDLAKVRDFIEEIGAMFYLEAGTLLGWYRDCSIIQHTTDLDISVPIEYFSESFNESIFGNDLIKVWKQFGRVNDSLELATFLGPFGRGEKLDIFFNYEAENYSFVGGWAPPNFLMWYQLPRRKGYCSGDLFGHLFSVPCNVDDWLIATYGKDFMRKQAAEWERKNGTYGGPVNYHIYGTYENSLVAKGYFKHPLYGT